jgi:peptidoglycan/xylan/chitin deacetylase (PgdA/CDA1 family)
VAGAVRRIGRRRGLILLYHRVADPASDPWALSVSPDHFAEQLDVLRRHAHTVRLTDLIGGGRRAVADRSVAVTFDDGYADNLHAARPRIERFEIPCTFFLASGHLGSGEQFWWDQLARALLESPDLPPCLRLTVGGQTHQWQVRPSGTDADAEPPHNRRWLAWGQPDRGPRHTAFREVYALLQPLPPADLRAILDEILGWAGLDRPGPAEDRPLSSEEARVLASAKLVDIGAHTVNHPHLGSMPIDVQRDEIVGGKRQLERMLGRPVRLFAYPFGRACDYTPDTISLVRAAGYDAACSNFAGMVDRDTDRWQLPRHQVHDWDGDEFLRKLRHWLDD